jgi:hypothetical protein
MKPGSNVALYAVVFCVAIVTTSFVCCINEGCSDNPPFLGADGFLQPYPQWPGLNDGGGCE